MPDPTPPPADAAPTKRTVVTSAAWVAAGFGYNQAIRLVSSVIIAHLLYPQALGLMALAVTFLTGLALFSDLGIRTSVVQSKRGDDPAFLDTAWTLQVIRGLVLWAAACAVAWPAAYWRPAAEPDLLWLLPLLGATAAIDGLTSTKLLTLHRHLSQKRAVLLEAAIQTVAVAAMLAWAVADRSVLSLTVGPILASVLRAGLSHVALPGRRNWFRWDRPSLRELVHVARWIYLGTVMTFIAGFADRFVVGYQSLETLGVYHIAGQLVLVAVALMAAASGQLIFPVYSRFIASGRGLAPAFRRLHPLAGALSAVLVAGLIGAGPTLVRVLYDARYHDAGWLLPLMAAGAWFQIIEANAGAVFLSQGRPRISALANTAKVVCLAALIPLGTWLDGLRGMVLALIAGDVARYLTTALALRREGINIFRSDLGWTLFVAGAGLGARWLGEAAFGGAAGRGALAVRFLVEGAGVVMVWSVVMVALWRRGAFRRAET